MGHQALRETPRPTIKISVKPEDDTYSFGNYFRDTTILNISTACNSPGAFLMGKALMGGQIGY